MAKGYVETSVPELADVIKWLLPTGVTAGAVTDHGGVKRIEINGKEIKEQGYQLVVTADPHGRYIELVANPAPENPELGAIEQARKQAKFNG